MSLYDPPIIGSIVTAARTVTVILGLFCLVETMMERFSPYVAKQHNHLLENLSWIAISIAVIFGGTLFLFDDLSGMGRSFTWQGQLASTVIWSIMALGFVIRASSRAANPRSVFATGTIIFLAAVTISVITGRP